MHEACKSRCIRHLAPAPHRSLPERLAWPRLLLRHRRHCLALQGTAARLASAVLPGPCAAEGAPSPAAVPLSKRSSSERCPDKVKQAHLAQLQQYRTDNFNSMVRTDESWPSNKTEVTGVELSAEASSFRCSSQAFTYPRKRWWHSKVLLV